MSDNLQTARTTAGLDLMFPRDDSAPEIGNALALVLHIPLAAVHPTMASVAAAHMARMPLPGTRSLANIMRGLRILTALGDGIPGHPWIKGAAGIALEIVTIIDAS